MRRLISRAWKQLPVGRLSNEVALGLIVAVFNLKGFLAYAALHWSPSAHLTDAILAVTTVAGQVLIAVAGDDASLTEGVAHWIVTGFWWYLAASILAGVLLLKPRHTTHSLGGLAAGLAWFPVLCAVLLAAWFVVGLCVRLVGLVFAAIGWVFALLMPVAAFLGRVFLLLAPWALGLAAIAAAVVGMAWLVRNLRGRPLFLAVCAVGAAGATYLSWPVLQGIYAALLPALAWVGGVLGVLLSIVVTVLGTIVLVAAAVAVVLIAVCFLTGVLGLLGWLVVDQFRAAWLGGQGSTTMFLSGFSVGTAVAMLMMICIGRPEAGAVLDAAWANAAWLGRDLAPASAFAAVLPDRVEGLLAVVLQDASAPVFDAVLVLGLFVCATLGMFRLGEQKQELPLGEYLLDGKRFALLSGGAVLTPLLLVAAAMLPSEEG